MELTLFRPFCAILVTFFHWPKTVHCPRLKLVCNIVSSSRLDAKDGGLALLKISACRLFQKVLCELVGELDKLEDTKAKHEAEDAAKAGKKLQEVHPWDAFVHLHLGYQSVSAYCIYIKRDSKEIL